MAWTVPKTWGISLVTGAILNTQLKDNLTVLSTHTHTGAGGFGSATLTVTVLSTSSQTIWTFADQEASPDTVGELQRNSNDLLYFNGSVACAITQADQSASTPSMRTLGTSGTQASAGNHTH